MCWLRSTQRWQTCSSTAHSKSDVFVGNSLVDIYAKCGSIEDAWGVFNKLPSGNVVTGNAILGGCAMQGHGKEVLKHFE
jgi:pentatricopeptide repeat protein